MKEVLTAPFLVDQEGAGGPALRVVRHCQGVAAMVAQGRGTTARVVLSNAIARTLTILKDKWGRTAEMQKAAGLAEEVIQAGAARGRGMKLWAMAAKATLVTRDPAVRSGARQRQISGAHFPEPTGVRVWAVAVWPAARGVAAVAAAAAALTCT